MQKEPDRTDKSFNCTFMELKLLAQSDIKRRSLF